MLRYAPQRAMYDAYIAAVDAHVASQVAAATAAEKTPEEIAQIALLAGVPAMVYDWMAERIVDAVIEQPEDAQPIIYAHGVAFSIRG